MGFTEPCTPQKQADGFVTMQSVGSMPAREWQPGPHPTDGSDWAAAARVGQPLHPSSLPSQHHLLHATSLPRTWHGAGDQAPPPIRTEPRPEARQGSEHSSGLTPRIAEMSLQLPQAPSWPEAEAAPGARAPHAGEERWRGVDGGEVCVGGGHPRGVLGPGAPAGMSAKEDRVKS